MPINALMSGAVSGLETAQTALTTVSDNITNINTPGYVREVVQQSPVIAAGQDIGVTVDQVQRVTNQYLEAANYNATSSAGSANIISNLLSQAQGAFGDPSQASSYLNQLSTVFSDFSAAANDPASNLPRSQTVDDLNTFLDTTQDVAGTLSGIGTQTDCADRLRRQPDQPAATRRSTRSTPTSRTAAAPGPAWRARRTARASCWASFPT